MSTAKLQYLTLITDLRLTPPLRQMVGSQGSGIIIQRKEFGDKDMRDIMKNKILYVALAVVLLLLIGMTAKVVSEKATTVTGNIYERNYTLDYRTFDFDGTGSKRNTIYFPVPIDNPKYYNLWYDKLYYSLVAFYDESEQEWWDPYYPAAMLQLATNKYISLSMWFGNNAQVPHPHSFRNCVTVDLEREKEVFLNDLVDVNDEFIQMIKDGRLAQSDDRYTEIGDILDFSKYTTDELKQKFNDCSRPISKDDDNIHYLKPSFYLTPGRICFVNFEEYNSTFYIRVDDIEKYLASEPDDDGDGVPNIRDREPNTPKGSYVNFWGESLPPNVLNAANNTSSDSNWWIPSIFFDFDKYSLRQRSVDIIKEVALHMMRNPDVKVEIRGYADAMGTDPYNLKLTVRRCLAAKRELVEVHKIDESRIVINGFGRVPEPNKKFQLNRRCDFFFDR